MFLSTRIATAFPPPRLGDFKQILEILVYLILSWSLPKGRWKRICLSIASISCRLRPDATKTLMEQIAGAFGEHPTITGPDQFDLDVRASRYEQRLQILREHRPDRLRANIRLNGQENLEAALTRGSGAILWVSDFTYSGLMAKMALHKSGFAVTHLSRPNHGFSGTPFGIRFLNPLWTRVENRYLAERVVIRDNDTRTALNKLRERLNDNGIISITVTQSARKLIEVPFMTGRLPLPTGPLKLAIDTGAPLLPVFAVQDRNGAFDVCIGSPLEHRELDDVEKAFERALRTYAALLEPYVRQHPGLWRSWGTVLRAETDAKAAE